MNHTKERIEELFQGLLRAAQRSDNMSAGAHAIIGRGAALPGEDLELLLALSDRTEQQTQKALDDWNDEKIPEAEFVHRARLLASVDAYLVARLKHYGAEAPERLIIDWEQLDPVQKQQANNSRANVLVEYHGELLTLQQASEASGISYTCLKKRRDRKPGITEEELFRAPKRRTPSAASSNKKSERPADRPQK